LGRGSELAVVRGSYTVPLIVVVCADAIVLRTDNTKKDATMARLNRPERLQMAAIKEQ
jgi:hypothetical protein